ncbi:MAG: protein kinase [Planctomycetaceae bacterium]
MNEQKHSSRISLSDATLDRICDEFEAAWKAGQPQSIRTLVDGQSRPDDRAKLLTALLEIELECLAPQKTPQEDDYLQRFPREQACVHQAFENFRQRFPERFAGTHPQSLDQTALMTSQGQPSEFRLPHEFGERYTLTHLLGGGGMGEVYRAFDKKLQKEVALKIPRFDSEDPNQASRFVGEARAAARIEHPGICPVYDIADVDGRLYITMKLIEGKSLEKLLNEGRTFSIRQAVALIRKAAEALAVAHQKKIVHRDIKPANIMLTPQGEAIVVDFGLALADSRSGERLTGRGDILGTPAYMPIEQAKGDLKKIGHRTDVYSLAAVLFRLLTGRAPYRGNLHAIIGQIHAAAKLPETRPSLTAERSDLDPQLVKIVERGMAFESEDRYPSMQAFADDLKQYQRQLISGEKSQTNAAEISVSQADANTVVPNRSSQIPGKPRWPYLVATACLLPLLWWLATVFLVRTENGILKIEVSDPRIQVLVDGNVITIDDADRKLELSAGPQKKLIIKSNDLQFEVEKEFSLKKSDGEKRLHVVLLENGQPDLREGAMPRIASKAPTSSTQPATPLKETAIAEDSRNILLQADFDADDPALLVQGGTAEVAVSQGRLSALTHRHYWTNFAATEQPREPVAAADFDLEVTARIVGPPQSSWGIALTDSDSQDYRHGITINLSASGVLQMAPNPSIPIEQQELWSPLMTHPAIHTDGSFNDLKISVRGGRRISIFANGQCVLHDHELRHSFTRTTVALISRVRDDRAESIHPCRAEFDRLVVYAAPPNGVDGSPDAAEQARLTQRQPNPAAPLWAAQQKLASDKSKDHAAAREELIRLRVAFPGTEQAITAGQLLESAKIRNLPPVYSLKDTSEEELESLRKELGGEIPEDIVGVFGESHLKSRGHLWSVAFSPDGSEVVAGGDDHTPRIWNALTGRLQHALVGHNSLIHAVAWSPDGRWIASGDDAGLVCLWDAATGELRHRLELHQQFVHALAFTTDNTKLVTAGGEDRILVWDVATGAKTRNLASESSRAARSSYRSLIALPDGKTLFSARRSGHFEFWNLDTGERINTWRGPGGVQNAALSPSGELIATAGDDRAITVWELSTGKQTVRLTRDRDISGVVFGRDDDTIISVDEAPVNNLTIWSVKAGTGRTLIGQRGAAYAIAFSSRKSQIASAGQDNRVRLWNALNHHEWPFGHSHDSNCRAARVLSDGSVISGGWDGSVIRNSRRGKQEWRTEGHGNWLNSIGVDLSETQILVGTMLPGPIQTLDAKTGGLVTRPEHNLEVFGTGFSPSNPEFATVGIDSKLRRWSSVDGQLLAEYSLGTTPGRCLTWSADGRLVAAGGRRLHNQNNNRVYIHDVQQNSLVSVASCGQYEARQMCFHPNGESLYVISDDLLRRVRVRDGKLVATTQAVQGIGMAMAISPSGRILAVAGMDGMVRFLDEQTLGEFHTVQIGTNGGWINDLSFSPDGRYAVAACGNGTAVVVAVPELPTSDRIKLLHHLACDGTFGDVGFLGDGHVIGLSDPGMIHVWNPSGKLLETLDAGAPLLRLDTQGGRAIVGGENSFLAEVIWDGKIHLVRLDTKANDTHDVQITGSRALTVTDDGIISQWDLSSQKRVSQRSVSGVVSATPLDNNFVVSGSSDGTLRLWNDSGQLSETVAETPSRIYAIRHIPGKPWFVNVDWGINTETGTQRPRVYIRDVETLEEVYSFEVPCLSVADISLSSTGRYLAVTGCGVMYDGWWRSPGQLLCVYDLFTGQLIQSIAPQRGSVRWVDISDDESRIVIATGNDKSPASVYSLTPGESLPDGLDPLFERLVVNQLIRAGCSLEVMFPGTDQRLFLDELAAVPNCTFWVQKVNIYENARVSPQLLGKLSQLHAVAHLKCPRSQIRDRELAEISKCRHLETLVLEATQVTDDGISALAGHSSLRGITLGETRITDTALAAIKTLPNLTDLYIAGTQITTAGLDQLAQQKNLRLLYAQYTRVDDSVAELLKQLPHLEKVSFWGSPITAELLPTLADMKSLSLIGLSFTNIKPEDCHILKSLPNLRTLELTKANASDEEVEKLQQAIPWCSFDLK